MHRWQGICRRQRPRDMRCSRLQRWENHLEPQFPTAPATAFIADRRPRAGPTRASCAQAVRPRPWANARDSRSVAGIGEMSAPDPLDQPVATPARPRMMSLRKYRAGTPPTREQSKRQGDVIASAWRHFGEPGPVIAFLNTRHDGLGGQPLHLAIESDAGLERVRALLGQLTLKV